MSHDLRFPYHHLETLANPSRLGLSSTEAASRLQRDGPNKIDGSGKVSIGEVLLRQVSNSLTIVGSKILWRHWF